MPKDEKVGDIFTPNKHNISTVIKKISELEKKYKDLEERYRESGGLRCTRDRGLIKKVLWDHLKSHIVVAREQLTDKDKLTIFREFDEAIQKQLEKLDSNIKVSISRNDGEKGKNSKEVISSNENNLSTPERRKDGDSEFSVTITPSGVLNASKIILPKIIENGLKEMEKDGEKEVEEISNKNLCREESNIDILPPSKPSRIICREGVCTYGEPVEYCERYNCNCYNYEKLHEIPKEPTDDIPYEKDMIIYKGRAYNQKLHRIVSNADLEEWRDELKNKYSKSNVIKQIEKYLEEEKK